MSSPPPPYVRFADGSYLTQDGGTNWIFVARSGVKQAIIAQTLAGLGVPNILASSSTTGNTAAITNAINFTPPATAGVYRLTILYRPTATGVATSVGITVTYKEPPGAQSTTTIPFLQNSTTTVVIPPFTNTGGAFLVATHVFQIDTSGTAITVSTTGTFTGTTYNFAATLEQLA